MCELILIRHGTVQSQWQKICYGALDVPLSEVGQVESQELASILSGGGRPQAIFHSNLTRTRFMAEALAETFSGAVEVVADDRLRERDYGQWQGLTWDEAYQCDPDHFHDLIAQPDTYRPPDGETTTEMQKRVASWYESMLSAPTSMGKRIIAVSHSGPIAALAGWLTDTPATQWAPWMIKPLEFLVIDHRQATARLTKGNRDNIDILAK